jgi:hypothetical protein
MKLLPDEFHVDKIKNLGEAKEVIVALMNLIEAIYKENEKQAREIQQLKDELARFKKQPKRPSIQITPKDYSSRKQIQGQKNWQKQSKPVEVDREEQLPEVQKCTCGGSEFTVVRTWNKIVQGLIIKRDNIKYLGRDKRCLACGTVHQSQLPTGVNGSSFSPQLRSWLSVFRFGCEMSELKIQRFLGSLDVKISKGQLNEILLSNGQRLGAAHAHLKVWGFKIADHLHSDATGLVKQILTTGRRVKKHLQFVGHDQLSWYKITRRYNAQTLTDILGKVGLSKIYISDDASPNGQNLRIQRKQICWIHEIRHYQKLSPRLKTHREELRRILDEIWIFYRKAKRYGRDPTPAVRLELESEFENIVETGVQYEELRTRLRLTARKKDRLLTFLDYPEIPIENNLAEREIRPAVLMRKRMGSVKSELGEQSFERHMSVIRTVEKRGLHVFDTVHGLMTGQLSPFVLTAQN